MGRCTSGRDERAKGVLVTALSRGSRGLGRFPFEYGSGSGSSWTTPAQRYRWGDLLPGVVRHGGIVRRHWTSWPHASLALSPWPVRMALKHAGVVAPSRSGLRATGAPRVRERPVAS